MASTDDAISRFIEPFTTWPDVLDVLLVMIVLYNLLLLIRGTRAAQVVLGLVVVVMAYLGARTFRLPALETTLEKFLDILPLAILVLFQHEIRRALASFGRTPAWRFGREGQDMRELYNDVAVAASTLSDRKVGALIAFERREGLRNYIENGIKMDAVVSLDLLISLFHPETPTHDGAVVIQGNRIAAATCFLPLTRNPELSTELGTRHRAAIGVTEETDAVALIVSEETGGISLAVDGTMHRHLSSSSLKTLLFKYLVADDTKRGLDARGSSAGEAPVETKA
ncbi:MAG: diadenylate cyclase CdaA [Acidobacteriota bacterium]